MADVPDDAVVRCVEHVVQRCGQFDDAKAGAEVSARYLHCVDGFLAQFVGELAQLTFIKAAKVVGCDDLIEQRRFRRL